MTAQPDALPLESPVCRHRWIYDVARHEWRCDGCTYVVRNTDIAIQPAD